ncbi:MAG: hypothetical protein IJH61_08585 [Eubacteriaceae bacterium]|nr:hypothetical protein [Eubacteriaceae bacterium]
MKDYEIMAFAGRQKEVFEAMMDKDDEELAMMINSGAFNHFIIGYGLAAMEMAEVPAETVESVKAIFPYVFESMAAMEALEKSKN